MKIITLALDNKKPYIQGQKSKIKIKNKIILIKMIKLVTYKATVEVNLNRTSTS